MKDTSHFLAVRVVRIAAVFALVVVALQSSLVASAQSVSTQIQVAPPPVERIGQGEGLDTIAGCVNANGRLLVEVLFDSSGSLEQTDPDALRVPALKAALGSLLSISNTQSKVGQTQVEVEVSRFDDNYYKGEGFAKLDSSSINSFLDQAESFRDKNKGDWTDYVVALRGAGESLENRAAQFAPGEPKPCKAIFWFTDGGYDISGTGLNAKDYAPGLSGINSQDAGQNELCKQSGIADQLRQAGIVDVAVALKASNYSTELLERIVLGRNCGVSDGASKFGVVLGVSDVTRLTATMLEAISGTRGQQQVPGEVCSADPCVKRVEVRVPVGVGSFYLLTRANEGVQRWISAPGGQAKLVEPGRMTIEDTKLETTRISPTTLMIDVTLSPQSPATGVWTISFVDPTGAAIGTSGDVDAYFFGALRPEIDPSSRIRQGEPTDLVVNVVDAGGNRVDLATAQRTRLNLAVTDPVTGAVAKPSVVGPDAQGRFVASYTASMSSTAAAMNIMASLSVIMDGGLALRPTIAEAAVPVTVPVTVPSLETTELVLPKVEGRSASKGTLTVRGPERGAGVACIADWKPERVPGGVESISNESTEKCQTVQPGATKELQVAFRPDHQGNGYVTGFVQVSLTSESNSSDSVTKSVPVKFRLIRSSNTGVKLLSGFIFAFFALFIPLVAFYLALKALTRFRGLDRLQWAEVPVRIENGTIIRTDVDSEGSSYGAVSNFRSKPEGEWEPVGLPPTRRFTVGRGHSFTLYVIDRLSQMSEALITVAGADIAGRQTSHDFLRRRKGVVAPLDQLSSQWAFAIDSIEFPAIDSGFGERPQDTTAEEPERSVINGAVLMFVDDFYGWRVRANETFMDVAVSLVGVLESHVATAWKQYRKQVEADASQGDHSVLVSERSWAPNGGTDATSDFGDSTSSGSTPGWSPDSGNKESPW